MNPSPFSSTDHRALQEYIDEGTRLLIQKQVEPWLHFRSRGVSVRMIDGTEVSYEGIEFDGSPMEIFWSRRYIDPYIRHFVDTFVSQASTTARSLGQDVGVVLSDIGGMLNAATGKVLDRMADIDQRVRGNGHPDSVKRRNVGDRREEFGRYIERRVKAEYSTELLYARTAMIQGAAKGSALVDSFSSWLLAGYAGFVALLVSNAESLAFMVQPTALTYCLYGLAITAGLGLIQKAMAAMIASRQAGEAAGRKLADEYSVAPAMSIVVDEIVKATLPPLKGRVRHQLTRISEGDWAFDGRASYRLAQWQTIIVALQTLLAILLLTWMAWQAWPSDTSRYPESARITIQPADSADSNATTAMKQAQSTPQQAN